MTNKIESKGRESTVASDVVETEANSTLSAAPSDNAIVDFYLLDSLREKARYLHMGYSPVKAIERCFALANAGLVSIGSDNWVTLTPTARSVIANTQATSGFPSKPD